MLNVNNLVGFGAGGENLGPKSIERTASAYKSVSTGPHTFSSISFGDTHSSRYIIVGVIPYESTLSGVSVSSLTIGGVSASKILEQSVNGNYSKASYWIAKVTSSTSGDIVITYNYGPDMGTHITVYNLRGVANAETPKYTGGSGVSNNSVSYSATINDLTIADTGSYGFIPHTAGLTSDRGLTINASEGSLYVRNRSSRSAQGLINATGTHNIVGDASFLGGVLIVSAWDGE